MKPRALNYDRSRSPEYYECLVVIIFCGYRGLLEFMNACRLHHTVLVTHMQMAPYRASRPRRRKETAVRFLECLHSGYQETKHNLLPYQRDYVRGWILRWKSWLLTCLERHNSIQNAARVPVSEGRAIYYADNAAACRARLLEEFQMTLDAFVFDL